MANDELHGNEARAKRVHVELETLHAALEREIRKDRRGRYMFLVVGLLATGLVFFYMYWLHKEVKRTITPRGAAELVESYTREILPPLGQELSHSLKAAAPDVANELRTAFLNDVLPEIRSLGEEQLLSMAGEAVVVAEAQMVETVTAIVREHKAEIREHALSDQTLGPNPLAQALEKALQLELDNRLSTRPEEPLYAQLEQSKRQLRALDEKLRALARKKDPNRVESLEKRLITSWMALVDRKMKESDQPRQPPAAASVPSPAPGATPGAPAEGSAGASE